MNTPILSQMDSVMCGSIAANLADIFQAQYAQRDSSKDTVRFLSDGEMIETAHCWVVSLHSSVLNTMLQSQMCEASTGAINVSDEFSTQLPVMIRFFYGLPVEITDF